RPGVHCLAGGMATSGAITEWLASLLGSDFAALTEAAAAVPPGADGLLVLPYFAGERTPLFDPRARGVVAGLTLRHGRGHLYRAVLEGVAYGVRHNLEAMQQAGATPRRLVPVGGGTTGDLAARIVSSVTGLPQGLPRATTGAAYCDAMLPAVATGAASPAGIAAWNPVQRRIVPVAGNPARYDDLYQRYLDLYPSTRATVHWLAGLSDGGPDRAG